MYVAQLIWSIILGVALVILGMKYINLRRTYLSTVETSSRLIAKGQADIQALEIGKDELQETYEQQFLSHLEKISSLTISNECLRTDLEDANGIIEYHAERCHGLVEDTLEQIMDQLRPTHQKDPLDV